MKRLKWLGLCTMILGLFMLPVAASGTVFAHQAVSPATMTEAEASETVVTVQATIREIRGYDSDHEHQHLLVDQIKVEDIENGTPSEIPDRAFVSIRIDGRGIGGEIPSLRVGTPIEIKGEFIPEEEAYKTPHNCCDAVIHFTHDPLGYVYYDGVLYR